MNISVLLTCYNRRLKTVACLQSLLKALDAYNANAVDKINMEIFLTDDGCTDGTAEAARQLINNSCILHISQGNGNLYWAGGMRLCWQEAMKRHAEWDYYLLINDDTEMINNLFDELFNAQHFALDQFGQEGLVSGITCSKEAPYMLTYGGFVWKNRFLGTRCLLRPTGKPQTCDLVNANILLIPHNVIDVVGIFFEGYKHGQADFDYSNQARKAGIPVVLTANFCGRCDRDKLSVKDSAKKISSMSLVERKAYFENPISSNRDYLCFIRRTTPIRYPMVWLGRMLNLYFPKFYYRLSDNRK